MFNNVVNLINNVFQPSAAQQIQSVPKTAMQVNPFATPFITVQSKRQAFYGKNNPVPGGYFAGYHNNQQNIVGRKLFIDV